MRALGAGLAYVAAVFALGAVLGGVRALMLEPLVGPVAAVLIKLPLILAAAWIICGKLVARLGVPARWAPRLGMGAVAFAVLIGAEFALAVATGQDASGAAALYGDSAHRIGLAGQILFALMPLLRLLGPRRAGGA